MDKQKGKDMKSLEITNGQVREIVSIVSDKFYVKNNGNYYSIVDKKTKESSLEDGKTGSLVSYRFNDLIRFLVLKFSGKTQNELMWDFVGVDVSNENQNYIFRVKDAVVTLMSGFGNNK